ncbi:MAG: homoserine kinase [Anaeromicrobium sp.]|jgi:homoserine kinase|uniref:homoserine kinase n=1 Tax=Anaeromicrobium sp. TaxID=1929132 RepID=UPI0025F95ABE|nr:homoserine kinase [Anaeromicrobium sp.]MCT4595171.1 homoserine kinase [Anaeromicrobium sp.]
MIRVQVPATTANVGPGFDALGIALDLYNVFYMEEIDSGLIIEGVDEEFKNEDNLIYQSMVTTFEEIGYRPKGIRIKVESNIPVSRGLGSSATCIVGGIMGANALGGSILDKYGILKIATEIEGHPDNVAPCIFGGMVTSIYDKGEIHYSKIPVKNDYSFCPLIPNFKLSTSEARGVLPEVVDYKKAVFNVGRVALLIGSLVNGEDELLGLACDDVLHQPYRGGLIRDYDNIVNAVKEAGVKGVFLSGAGPTIMTIVRENHDYIKRMNDYLSMLEDNWIIKDLKIDNGGAFVEECR